MTLDYPPLHNSILHHETHTIAISFALGNPRRAMACEDDASFNTRTIQLSGQSRVDIKKQAQDIIEAMQKVIKDVDGPN